MDTGIKPIQWCDCLECRKQRGEFAAKVIGIMGSYKGDPKPDWRSAFRGGGCE